MTIKKVLVELLVEDRFFTDPVKILKVREVKENDC